MPLDGPRWYAVWTHSHCEQLVHEALTARGFHAFLPMIREWSKRAGVRRLIPRPMFPGYLFVHEAMDKQAYIEIAKTRGLVRILGERWDSLEAIDDAEIESIRRFVRADVEIAPYPYLHEGQRVRVTGGALSGVEGYLVRTRPTRGLLVISVELLRRSVSVEIEIAAVEPVGAAVRHSRPAGVAAGCV